jgi:uncharacterized protein YjaZ
MKNNDYQDKLSIYGKIPERKVSIIESGVFMALDAVRESLGVERAVRLRIFILPRIQNKVISSGRAYKNYINIFVTQKYLNSRKFFKKFPGTVIHEYIHFLRISYGVHRAKTVLEALIEEGIAIYIQSVLSEPPDYLDIKTLDKKMVRLCWEKLSNVIDEPIKKYPQLETHHIYRTIYYRLGFGIIRHFVKLNPKITFFKLLKCPTKRIKSFVQDFYTPLKNKEIS